MSDSYRDELKEAIGQIRHAENEIRALYQFVVTYPGFAWIKRYVPERQHYIMVCLSNQYVIDIIGSDLGDYVGRTDFDFWPHKIAMIFLHNDDAARRAEHGIWVEEEWTSPNTGESGLFKGYKWSFTVDGITYVAGVGRGHKKTGGGGDAE